MNELMGYVDDLDGSWVCVCVWDCVLEGTKHQKYSLEVLLRFKKTLDPSVFARGVEKVHFY